MKRLTSLLETANKRLEGGVLAVGSLLLSALVLENFWQIMARAFWHSGKDWSSEVLIIGLMWLGLTPAFILIRRRRGTIVFELFYEHAPGRSKRILDVVNDFFTLATCLAFTLVGVQFMRLQLMTGASTDSSLNTPLWVPTLSMVVGLGLVVLASLELMLKDFRSPGAVTEPKVSKSPAIKPGGDL